MLPRWKRLTVRARLHQLIEPVELIEFKNKEIKLIIADRTSVYWAKYGPDIEPATNAWIASFRKEDIFVDIGANVGLYSLFAASVGIDRVYSIEPNPFSFGILVKNILANGYNEKIVPLCLAMNETQSIVSFTLGSTQAGSIGNEIASQNSDPDKDFIVVPSFSLDDLFRMQSINLVTKLKIDVDGLESTILGGAKNLLSSEELKSVLIEDISLKDGKKSEIDLLMERYQFFQTDKWGGENSANKIYQRK